MISETAQNNPEACSPQCLEISYFIFITDINTLHKLLLLHPCPLYLPQKQLLTLRQTGQARVERADYFKYCFDEGRRVGNCKPNFLLTLLMK